MILVTTNCQYDCISASRRWTIYAVVPTIYATSQQYISPCQCCCSAPYAATRAPPMAWKKNTVNWILLHWVLILVLTEYWSLMLTGSASKLNTDPRNCLHIILGDLYWINTFVQYSGVLKQAMIFYQCWTSNSSINLNKQWYLSMLEIQSKL